MTVTNTTLLSFFCIFLILFYFILYFSKSRLNNDENKIYKVLLGLDILLLIFQIVCENVVKYYDFISNTISELVFKSNLILILAFTSVVLIYLISITHNKKGFSIGWKVVITLLILASILISYLPIHFYSNDITSTYYYFGISAKFTYYTIIFILACTIMSVLIKFKTLKFKKALTLLIFSILEIMSIYLQMKHPMFALTIYVDTLLCVVMFFVIENPDLKMLERIEESRKKIEEANQAKSEFMLSMSHEIRTPLSEIVGFSENLKEMNLSDEAKENVNDIINASESLMNQLNTILDFSSLEDNNIKIYESNYDFRKIFNKVVNSYKDKVGKNVEFRYNLASDIPSTLYGDSDRIKQAIYNLVSNSVKYTKSGYINFNVRCLINSGICRLVISVEDSGVGFKSEELERLLNNLNSGNLEGSSIAVTKSIVELMKGKLIVQSYYNRGSQFMIVLDQRIVDNLDLTSSIDIIKDLSNKKVLIVDDNKLNIKVERRILNNYNVIIDEVTSGKECIEIVKNNSYDLILMDDKMPNMSGVETLKRLRADNNFNTPVVVLTASVLPGEKEKYIEHGFNDYLAKPIDKDELNRVIKKYLK